MKDLAANTLTSGKTQESRSTKQRDPGLETAMLGFFSITGTCLCSYALNISGLLFVLQGESDLLIFFFFSHKGTVVPKILKFEPISESQGDHETVPGPETLPLWQQTLTLHTIKGHPHIFTTMQHKSPGPGAIPPYSKGWCI